ncbi:MAG TPA: YkvA family protein, partial [Dehalococcoidia bacterium]
LARRIGRLSMRNKLALGRALFGDRRVSIWAKFIAIALAVYLASPVDIIPDFIPVLGVLDDVVVVLAGVGLLLRAVQREVVEEHIQGLEQGAGEGPFLKERYE